MAGKAPAPWRPTTVVAIDFGTAACGYCLASAPTGTDSAVPTAARVYPFKPGDRAAAATEKNLTAILMENTSAMKVVSIGREARRRFYELEGEEARNYLYLQEFKMAMAPSKRGGIPLAVRTVHALGGDKAIPLLTAVGKILGYIREEAMDRARGIGVDTGKLAWVLTVPAIWDDEAKAFMRLAAVEAGIIPEVESERLLLALEPEGAVIASAIDAPPELRKQLRIGQRVMILDCGGGTVDVTVSELVGMDPPRLKEILPASGDAWGGTIVDAQFRKFANDLLVPDGAALRGAGADGRDHAALSACLDAWESGKCGWDPADPARDKVVVAGLASVCEWVGGPEEMQKRVAAYNATHGLDGSDAVVYRARSFSLVLPPRVVRGFFDHCVQPICQHMQDLLIRAAEIGKSVGFVFLVGGFAESVYLQRAVREALETEDGGMAAALIVPAKPVQCVNRGAAVWGLYPSAFITSRVSKFTYAVSLCERYNPAVHDPVPHPSYMRVNEAGTWVAKVLVPLVQMGSDVPVDFTVAKEVAPVEDKQNDVAFVVYRLDKKLADPVAAPRSKRMYVIADDIAGSVAASVKAQHASENAEVAKVTVDVSGRGARAERTATLSLFFGRTEITASAASKVSGDKKKVTINWERHHPGGATGASGGGRGPMAGDVPDSL